jgi:hypothetical protein
MKKLSLFKLDLSLLYERWFFGFRTGKKNGLLWGCLYWVDYWVDGIILPVMITGNNGMVFTGCTGKFWLVVY